MVDSTEEHGFFSVLPIEYAKEVAHRWDSICMRVHNHFALSIRAHVCVNILSSNIRAEMGADTFSAKQEGLVGI